MISTIFSCEPDGGSMPLRRHTNDINTMRITLGLLNAASEGKPVSQRRLATEMGIALGLVNAYVKRCVKKGLLKVSEAPARRYIYYLTPEGLSEKTRLTSEFLTSSLEFFRRTRRDCTEMVAEAERRGWVSIAFVGASDIAEIAKLCLADSRLQLVAVIDENVVGDAFRGVPVVPSLDNLGEPIDGVFVTAISGAEGLFGSMVSALGAGKVLVPELIARGFGRTAATTGG